MMENAQVPFGEARGTDLGTVSASTLTAASLMGLPEIYAYLDYRQFLRDWFDAKKAVNPRYSHRLFARRAEQRSPSMLLFVMEGKRNLKPRTVQLFASAMGLNEEESAFFSQLVAMDQAELPADRAVALTEVMKTTRFREARRLESHALSYFKHWYFPAIHELAYRADFRADPEWIAQTLCPSIEVDQAREALLRLMELGLLADDDTGTPRPTDAAVVTPHEVLDVAVNAYHDGMLERAREAIGAFEQDERHILGVTTAIPESLVPEIKEQLNQIQRTLLSACEVLPKERVYQISIAFFPLTRSPEAS
jgi:uncharacterized protein (TIGR02147 family)